MSMGNLLRSLIKVMTTWENENHRKMKYPLEDKYPPDEFPLPPKLEANTYYSENVISDIYEVNQENEIIMEITPLNGRLEMGMYPNLNREHMRFDLEEFLWHLEKARDHFKENIEASEESS